MWIALVTSDRFGVEREVIEKATLDRIPLPDFRVLSRAQKDEVLTLFDGLQRGDNAWNEVDRWIAEIYGLGPRDLQVISDTLEFNLPFAHNKREAQAIPTDQEQIRFCKVLESELAPWCARFDTTIAVRPVRQPTISPWYGIEVRRSSPGGSSSPDPRD